MRKLMNRLLAILTISLSSVLTINFAFADTAKLVNPTNNHAYKRFDTKKTWGTAKTACSSQGGYLATITSQAEQNWIVQNGLQLNNPWIGATDSQTEGVWKWVTGESFTYTKWATGMPDNAAFGEDYLVFVGDGTWNDRGLPTNDEALPYICEWNLKNYTSMITGDTNYDGANEFVLIGNNGTVNKVVSIDIQNKTVVSEVDFSSSTTYNAVSLSIIDDINANGKAEFSLLLTKKSDGSSVIETRDSGTGSLIESYTVPR